MRKAIIKLVVSVSLSLFCFFAVFSERAEAAGFIPVNLNGKIYCINDLGTFVTNSWVQIGDGIFYFGSDGALVTNTVVDGFTIGADGRIVLPQIQAPVQAPVQSDSAIAQYCLNIINSVTNAAMTPDQKLAACYSYVVNNHRYNRTYETPMGNWTAQYAMELFSNGYGNCYRFAAGFAYLAKALGYETKVITGNIRSARGGVTPHSWVEIFYNGGWYICDPELQMAKGRDLYMKTYDNYPIKPLNKALEWGVAF